MPTTAPLPVFTGVPVAFVGQNGGVVDMTEVPPGHMPPLHVHHTHDELFYVIAGELSLFLPGRQVRLGAGESLRAPQGVPHAYRVDGDGPVRMLTWSEPAGFERFVADVAALDEQTPEALTAVAAQHDIEILGPPGMLP
jgi:mannose-6-phosphate isomerase-like protein (cupin superfamily)